MQLSLLIGSVGWKCPAKHPAKGRKALPFLSSPRFQKAQKMNCKKCWLKKIFDSRSIKTWKIKSIFFNITGCLSLEFELWPLAGSRSVLAWSSHTQPQMVSLRISHLSYSLLFIFFFIASVIDSLQSLRASKQGHGVMYARERQKNKGNQRATNFCPSFQTSLSMLTSLKRILATELRNGS